MIQRIQSIYLLLASTAIALLFFFPLAGLALNNQYFIFNYRGLYEIKNAQEILKSTSYLLAVLFSLSLLISLFTIFKYKNRKLQMRLCLVNIILLLVSVGLGYYLITSASSDLKASIHYQFVHVMPFIAIILSFLAYKGIRKDENLIKSIDRIR